MDNHPHPIQNPILREFDFHSNTRVVGPLIGWLRRMLYRLTAKWAVWHVMQQQNEVNQSVEQILKEYDVRLIEQDRDLTYLSRTIAELELQQHLLMKQIESQMGSTKNAAQSDESAEE